MKTALLTLNAKYIHTSLALRWLYVACCERFDVAIEEYTIKQNPQSVAQEIANTGYDIVAIAVYIWNVEQVAELIAELKELRPKTVIIIGGPEVSYQPKYFIESWEIDYLVSGEGEFVLGELLEAIESGQWVEIEGVSTQNSISKVVVQADIERLTTLQSPYLLERDTEGKADKILYFETSRGCPYGCHYCLSSLEKGVRDLPIEYIDKQLEQMLKSDVRQIKFLDRTFNIDSQRTIAIFQRLVSGYKEGLSCQFEIYADILSDDVVEWLNANVPKGYFRFEIGIQSTNQPTNRAVDRAQDFDKVAKTITKLMQGGRVDLHLDLIAGLPYETFELFRRSFDDVFALGAKELQLGFLKLLRGTALRRDAGKYGYRFDPKAPYQVISNDYLSESDMGRVEAAEWILDRFWNSGRFVHTMHQLLLAEGSPYAGRYFEFFDKFAEYYTTHNLSKRGCQLEDYFTNLANFIDSQELPAHEQTLREDYYSNFTVRPRGYWRELIESRVRKSVLHLIGQDTEFLAKHGVRRKEIEKQTALYPLDERRVLLTIFREDGRGKMVLKYELDIEIKL